MGRLRRRVATEVTALEQALAIQVVLLTLVMREEQGKELVWRWILSRAGQVPRWLAPYTLVAILVPEVEELRLVLRQEQLVVRRVLER